MCSFWIARDPAELVAASTDRFLQADFPVLIRPDECICDFRVDT
jgi:hypothetical protein